MSGGVPVNTVIQGDCLEVLRTLPNESVDLVITDPPYFVRYTDRQGRTIANDKNPQSVLAVFSEIARVLKPNSFCLSFYGWQAVDAFFEEWRKAKLRPVEHIVWHKQYASSTRFLQRCHEQAYVLVKGWPEISSNPLADVREWEYTGNKVHPTEKAVSVLTPLIDLFSTPGALVLDPFAGSGSTLVAAALLGRKYVGIEIEPKYCQLARKRLAGVAQHDKDLSAKRQHV